MKKRAGALVLELLAMGAIWNIWAMWGAWGTPGSPRFHMTAEAQGSKGELRVAIPWTPENLDPTMNLASIRAAVGASLFDSLVGRDTDGKLVPELAESWKTLDDTTWQFKLRRGVTFHNGEPFNAEAVRFTIQRVLDPEQRSPNRANIAEIARVDVVDDHTVNLVTAKPYAPFVA